MDSPDHTLYREWLYLDADGELAAEDRPAWERHLASCPECAEEHRALGALAAILARGRLPVREGFRNQVMAALPTAGWEARAPRAWSFPLAMVVLLAGLATALLGSGTPAVSGWEAVMAVGGMFRAGLLAGAGLLAASWRGVGMVFDGALTPGALTAFAVFVLCLNLFLVALLRRRRGLPAGVLREHRHGDGGRS